VTIAALAFSAVAIAQDDTKVTIQRTPKAGATARYKFNVMASAAGNEVGIEMTFKVETKEIKENGDVVRTVTYQSGKLNGMEQEMEVPMPTTVTVTSDKLGRVVKLQHGTDALTVMSPEAEQLVAMAITYLPPEKAVAPEASWQYEFANPMVKDAKATIKSVYSGKEKVDDLTVCKIKQTLTAATDKDGSKLTSELVFMVDPADGSVVRAEGNLKGLPTQYGAVDVTIKATRLKPETEPTPAKQ